MKRRKGFTLVEMLIVIGIIVSLLAIILPATMRAMKHAEQRATQAMLASVSIAVSAYYDVWQGFPGPIADEHVYAANAAPLLSGVTTPANVTGAENLVLGLYGGLQHDGAANVVFDPSRVGSGPYNLRPVSRTRTNGSFLKDERILSQGQIATSDTAVPELVDRNGIAILCYRGRNGSDTQLVAGGVNGAGLPGTPVQSPYIWNDEHYKLNDGIAYTSGSHGLRRLGVSQHPSDGLNPAGAMDFIPYVNKYSPINRTRPNLLLVAAGTDSIYGTSDDIVVNVEK